MKFGLVVQLNYINGRRPQGAPAKSLPFFLTQSGIIFTDESATLSGAHCYFRHVLFTDGSALLQLSQ